MDKRFVQVLKSFEKDLMLKLEQKCPTTSELSTFLNKTFKFFDIQSKGQVTVDQFKRAVQKLGVVLPSGSGDTDLDRIFAHYDQSGDGRIDYKELSKALQARHNGTEDQILTQAQEYKKAAAQPSEAQQELDHMMQIFRDRIKARGARGIIGLQRMFKIMDDDNSRCLSLYEFSKACRDFKTGISEEYMPTIFNAFDLNHDGTLSIDEFLMAIRGELNQTRLDVIEQAFNKIDKDSNGYMELDDIRDLYNADKHPDVMQGKRTSNQVLVEFLETFETQLDLMQGRQRDGRVTLEEFAEYYRNVSCSIDDDDYFVLVINNSWNVNGNADSYKKYNKGWSQEDQKPARTQNQPNVSSTTATYGEDRKPIQRSGLASSANPLSSSTQKFYTPTYNASKGHSTNQVMHGGPPNNDKLQNFQREVREHQEFRQGTHSQNNDFLIQGPSQMPKYKAILIDKFRSKLTQKGNRGLIGLQRAFKMMDTDQSGSLDEYEFTNAIKNFGIVIDAADLKGLFKSFDKNGDGFIGYDELIDVIKGPLNPFRQQIILRVFKQLDIAGSGVLTVAQVKSRYCAAMHPDVKNGKRTENEMQVEFNETFDQHHKIKSPDSDKVNPDEFLDYYSHVSANVDSDAYFELIMSNSWNLSGGGASSMPFAGSSQKVTAVNAREAYRNDHHRNLFGTDKATPFAKNQDAAWKSSNNENFQAPDKERHVPTAGGSQLASSGSEDPRMAWASKVNRETEAGYRGIQHTDDELTEMFRQMLAQRGARGIFGMQRIFKIMDDNSSGTLDIQEFWKALCDFRMPVSQEECRALFDKFDNNGDGEIQYDELLYAVAGELDQFRKDYVQKAFKKLDRDGNGVVEVRDLQGVYNAKCHPDVKSGQKTEDEVLAEFLDTFEIHYSLLDRKGRDGKVTLQEFMEYYRNVGASIDNDEYFALMMTNAWNLDNKTYAKGYGAQF